MNQHTTTESSKLPQAVLKPSTATATTNGREKNTTFTRRYTMLIQTLVKFVGEHCYYSLSSAARSSASTASSTVSTSSAGRSGSATAALRILKSSSPQKASLGWIQTVSSAFLLALPVVVMDEARKARRRQEGDPYIATAAHWSNPWMMANVGCKRSELLQLRESSSSASSSISSSISTSSA